MASIRWLHLTDLHVGATIPTSWPSMRAKLEDDLAKTQRYADGPFDLVLFTGDLVQFGKAEEYTRLDEVLEGLWETLEKLGSHPVLLAVPGNHDLVRPEEHLSAVRALIRWKEELDLAQIFWDDIKGVDYRDVVTKAFGPYTEWIQRWRKRHPLPTWVHLREDGKLPGDFAATIDHDGLKLGIIGLNSAFLQLAKRVGAGDLIVDPRQFHALCDHHPQAWAARHDLNWLMSHHPPEWLAQSAEIDYKKYIYEPNWFAGHICGHLHVPRAEERRIGGAEVERLFQGAALLGELKWETRDGKHMERVVGYGAVRIERKDEDFELRLWPRRMVPGPSGRDKFVPDQAYDLDDLSAFWHLSGRPAPARRPALAPTSHANAPEPPGRGYHPNWYIAQPNASESAVITNLANPGTPVMLTAPPLFGKSTFLQRIVSRLRDDDKKRGQGGLVLTLDLGALSEQAPEDVDVCIRELADLLVEQYAKETVRIGHAAVDTDGWVSSAWARPSTPERKLHALLKKNILTQPHDRIVLVLDRFDRLGEKPASLPVARLLRSFSEEAQQGDEVWSKVRIILATTGSHALLRTRVDAVSELFSVTVTVRLEPFGLRELKELQTRYGVAWSDDHLKRLLNLTGGWPFLSRQILYLAATGISADELLDEQRLMADHCTHQLQRLWLHVCEYDQLRRIICALLGGATLERDESQMLRSAGLVRHNEAGTGYEMMSQLVKTYFKDRCCGVASRVVS